LGWRSGAFPSEEHSFHAKSPLIAPTERTPIEDDGDVLAELYGVPSR
jgi:hypothetical protein